MWRKQKARIPKELHPQNIATLIASSKISEEEIRKWHADFLEKYPSGVLDKSQFITYCQALQSDPNMQTSFANSFDIIDANNDGMVDFNELITVIILTNYLQDIESRLAFAFNTWDQSSDGYIDREELVNVITVIYDYTGVTDRKGERDPKKRAKDILSKLDNNKDKRLSKEEFILGCKTDPIIRDLLAPHI